jgi:hypothetical protein
MQNRKRSKKKREKKTNNQVGLEPWPGHERRVMSNE